VPESFARAITGFLLAVHTGLGVWALVGFMELALPEVPWKRVSNPLFSSSMLLLQWSLITVAATVFISGYLRRWKHTPVAMLGVYGAMALVCAYQTFFILTNASRFRAMAIEYTEYAVILMFLFFSNHMQLRFSRSLKPYRDTHTL
jgi:hypothetical protein